jgi:hypothetical protein
MVSRIVLPVLNIEQEKKPLMKKVLKGAKQFTEQRINPQSSTESSTTFSFQPPSQNTVIDRCIYLECDVRLSSSAPNGLIKDVESSVMLKANAHKVTLDAMVGFAKRRCIVPVLREQVAGGGYNPANFPGTIPRKIGRPERVPGEDTAPAADGFVDYATGNNLAPRQFPLANAMQSLDVTINGTHFTVTPSEYIHAIMQYTTPQYRNQIFSGTAHMPDRNTSFMHGYDASPLNLAGEGSFLGELPRGTHLTNAFQFNDSVLDFKKIREPLFISPLLQYFGHGMTNINEINVTINWVSALVPHMFSYVPCNNVNADSIGLTHGHVVPNPNALSVTFPTNPNLVVRYYSPDDDIDIPAQTSLIHHQPYRLSRALGLIAPVANTLSFTGDNIRLNQIPAAVYIWIQKSTGTRNLANMTAFTDYHNPITQIKVNFGNQTSILGNLDQFQLLDLAVENGFDAGSALISDYNTNGNIVRESFCLKLIFGKDIPLPEGQTPGLRGDFNFQINGDYVMPMCLETDIAQNAARGDFLNLDGGAGTATANMSLEQLFIYSGKVEIRPQECTVETGIINVGDIVGAEDMGGTYDSLGYEGGSLVGGSHVGGSEVGGSAVGGGFGSLVSSFAKNLPQIIETGKKVGEAGSSAKQLLDAYKSRAPM